MENASKALIMAGSTLLAIMVITLGIFLFQNFAGTSKATQEELATKNNAEFNSKFTKYEGSKTITAHDIVSIINLARDNNEYYEVATPGNNSPYITVKVNGVSNGNGMEKISSQETLNQFISTNAYNGTQLQYFTCNEVRINPINGRVQLVTFTKN